MAFTARFVSSGIEDAETLKPKQVADMISKTLTNVSWSAPALKRMNIMLIPSNKVRFVIGKGGSRIREIESTLGVRLKLDETGEPNRKLWIQGSDENVTLARARITEILEFAKFAGGGIQKVTKILSIPSGKVGLLIGSGGCTIRKFCQEYSCNL